MSNHDPQWEDIVCAANTAIKYHGDQMYGAQPYVYHLSEVVSTVIEFTGTEDPVLVSAAWMHDILEDTTVEEDWLRKNFCKRVVDIVVGCTGVGPSRSKKQELIFKAMMGDYSTAVVKSADRLANIKHSFFTNNEDKLKMYQKEHEHFYTMSLKHRRLIPMTDQMARYLFFKERV